MHSAGVSLNEPLVSPKRQRFSSIIRRPVCSRHLQQVNLYGPLYLTLPFLVLPVLYSDISGQWGPSASAPLSRGVRGGWHRLCLCTDNACTCETKTNRTMATNTKTKTNTQWIMSLLHSCNSYTQRTNHTMTSVLFHFQFNVICHVRR